MDHLAPQPVHVGLFARSASHRQKRNLIAPPGANCHVSPVDLRDVARIAVKLLHEGGHESESLRITGPECLSTEEVAAMISMVIHKPVRYVNACPDNQDKALLETGVSLFLATAIHDQATERSKHPEAFTDLSTHELLGAVPTRFEGFTIRNRDAFNPTR